MEFEPYKIKKPEESDYLIAYIDLLGTKEYVEKGDDNVIFDYIYEAYTLATKLFSKFKVLGYNKLNFKIFSDNILIALNSDEETLSENYDILSGFLQMFLMLFVMKGIFFRGGITYGKLAIDDTIVWGKGLVEAVQLEEQISIYPRIVLSNSLVKLLNAFLEEKDSFDNKYSCFTDVDGCVYLDYIFYDKESTDDILEKSNKFTDEKLSQTKNPRVIQKYLWHKNYLKLVKEKFDSVNRTNENDTE